MGERRLGSSLAIFVLLCLGIEVIGGYWTKESLYTWYPTLVKPAWNPPGWVFGPVWTLLYLMIAVSGWWLYRAEDSPARTAALRLYAIQLALNFIWSFLFFSLQSPFLALVDILLLSAVLTVCIRKSLQVRPLAAWLLVPYLIWVLYATTLNAAIWYLNPS